MRRAIVLVLDSFGIGATADAAAFGDAGADTLGHIASACARRRGPLSLPNLARLGLFHAHRESTGAWAEGVTILDVVTGAYGYARELSSSKDTPSGHWEIAGVPVLFDWGYFEPWGPRYHPARSGRARPSPTSARRSPTTLA
ncbi:Metalloenzyme superfamily protein [Modicisalibacter muralis]|uniref:Metalloenzyme superfamily protein n=1 Tax=Modicisalibacter muralis TaxID=119000 RepID=A0A1G9I838_9GAMM|nr:Metalloenzyme superfamily protein [Halomonas muralis]